MVISLELVILKTGLRLFIWTSRNLAINLRFQFSLHSRYTVSFQPEVYFRHVEI